MLSAVAAVTVGGLVLTTSTAYADDATETEPGRRGPHGEPPVAEFLDMDREEMRAAHEDGKTIQDLLDEQGKTAEELHEYMKVRATERMQERGLTEEEIASRLAEMDERFANWDGEHPLGFMGGYGKGGPKGPHDGECPMQD